eukprot:9635252-Alexandrium_andersonii.AAC.1
MTPEALFGGVQEGAVAPPPHRGSAGDRSKRLEAAGTRWSLLEPPKTLRSGTPPAPPFLLTRIEWRTARPLMQSRGQHEETAKGRRATNLQ